ncbi:MAG: hypothetical protein UV73_C0012G0108 [Candidatus Gottesmanbacteria bacterium GW2011_GWA2_43_14]|uniref:Methyltransferase type 11 domain-containing protein n=1 Tax=Candidatus Gottesmanbacteria bacterium GW2011_GWA2_43_14 TaxID=1618443 RepID=A0A0G1DDW0_9BACT|nr:MAG: hypothetical protein UV73_C0012G0108 [Candidatus Gottesmanbacteria bacterium GW2011_GWA2_43_14]
MKSQKLLKINIGSGPIGRSDWINLDWGILPLLSKLPLLIRLLVNLKLLPRGYNKPWPSNPVLHDCRKKLPFSDSTVDFIYSSHFLEHLYRFQAIELLKDCKRILKPNGIIRIVVPDLAILAEKYLKNDKVFYNKLLSDSERKNTISKYLADEFVNNFNGYESWDKSNLIQKIQRLFIRGHLWMYDYESLKNILITLGFRKIIRCKPGIGKVPNIKYLDIHKFGSLLIESSK